MTIKYLLNIKHRYPAACTEQMTSLLLIRKLLVETSFWVVLKKSLRTTDVTIIIILAECYVCDK